MGQVYNVYCDESCHLENDHQKAMVLGCVWCPQEKVKQISQRIREIKQEYDFSSGFEMKWTKISAARSEFYLRMVDYFFDTADLHFRCLVIPDKSKLNHQSFLQSHDDWYYKMYFDMLKVIFNPNDKYRIYVDIKDTRSADKVVKLHDVLCNNMYDFKHEIIERVQIIRSHESGILQLADVLIGAMSYYHRELETNDAKLEIIKRIKNRSGYSLSNQTLLKEDKFNIFIWNAK